MRLLFVFVSILALSLAESEQEQRHYEDSEAVESIELQKIHDLKPEASVYSSVPYQPQQHYPSQPLWTKPNPPVYVPPVGPAPPPHVPVQNDYVPPHVPIADGTWVGEEGYFTNPKKTEESLVKKGWYQYIGADGRTYTVTYWADHTGYHAYGEHLPTPPPIPPAIQASIDQNAREEAAKAEAEKNKPYYPTTSRPIYYDPPQEPQQPYYPPQQPYYPPQQTQQPYYPPQQPQQPYYPPQIYPTGK
ncbi:putative cuticle protein [Operophtera brumata]|uniref:Putative cuticle protein n=1 Tax=Operophtera brumata TaxID=104452 RepID=A0A0L7LD50_OPEBR|nr:putative cuticle protein [Operophtera brumata]